MVECTSVPKTNWPEVVLKFRQDQQLVISNWKEVHKCSQQLNQVCDGIFRSLWILHTLSSRLSQVQAHRLAPSDWVAALDNSYALTVADGQQALNHDLLEEYSRFLSCLRDLPSVTSEIIVWAGNDGLSTPDLISDLLSTVYGGLVFQEDHNHFLQLILHLLSHHINQCNTYKDLFVFEHEFSRAITEYCKHIPSLSEYLVCSLQEPLSKMITGSKQYLEYDISKASTRLNHDDFNIVSYVDESCAELADMCTGVLKNLERFKGLFPPSLQWIIAKLKQAMKKKWPTLTDTEVCRPVSDLFFRYMISSAFTSPDTVGILDSSMIMNEMSSYNVSQVISVLQGCAWIMSRPIATSAEYPMKRVVKRMKMKSFTSLIDWLQTFPVGSSDDHVPVISILPGLKRNFFIASKDQLADILTLYRDASSSYTGDRNGENMTKAQAELRRIASLAPTTMIQSLSRNPYSFSIRNSPSSDIVLSDSPDRSIKKSKSSKQRSKSMWNAGKSDKGVPINANKSSTLSVSHSTSSVASTGVSFMPTVSSHQSFMPLEVFLIPLRQQEESNHRPHGFTDLWEFELLSEEEFNRNKSQRSPKKSPHSKLYPIADSTSLEVSLGLSQDSFSMDHSQDSNCSIPFVDNISAKSWSPETYNGSVSAEEDIKELEQAHERLTKSIEAASVTLEEKVTSTNEHHHERPEGRRKTLKTWISHRMKKRQKVDKKLNSGSPVKDVHRVGSYTKHVSHITEKYEKISLEKKKKEALEAANTKQTEQQLSSDSPLWRIHIPSGADEFMSLPLYSQLKYKLGVVLSNIHIPMSSYSLPKNCSKRELVILLEQALHRNMWIADSSECGVIHEILNALDDLDEDCEHALYVGVVQDQLARQDYLHYLTTSRRKFTDINLQLNSVQQSIDRSRHLVETSFLNFSIHWFLDNNHERIKILEEGIKSCETGDEICEMVQKHIDELTELLDMEPMWNVWPEEDLSRVNECLSNHLFSLVYEQTFKPNGETDVQRDKMFFDLLKDISLTIKPNHHLLRIQKVYLQSCPWMEVQRELLMMNSYKSPRGKLKCIVRACQLLIRSLQLSKCGDPPGADDTFPALVYVLIKSNPPNLLSTEQYIRTFCDTSLTGEDAYWWTQFQSAIGFLRTPAFTQP